MTLDQKRFHRDSDFNANSFHCESFYSPIRMKIVRVNKQDFFQVFQSSGIGKMEDNLTSADPLSFTTNGARVDKLSWGLLANRYVI